MLIKTHKLDHRITLMIALVLAITLVGHRLSSSDWLPKLYERDHLESLLDLSDAKGFRLVTGAKRLVTSLLAGTYPVKFEDLNIDIKFKHLTKIREDRRRAKLLNILHQPTTVPAKVSYRGHDYDVRLRLKGDLYPHWSGIKRWSFRIRLKNGATIGRMSQFSLQRPRNRQFPHDQIFHDWGRHSGNLEPAENFFRVTVNGTHWGIMLAEEHMSKHFIETNGRKEAPIVRFGSEEGWVYARLNAGIKNVPTASFGHDQVKLYSESRYLNNPHIRSLYSHVVKSYRDLSAGRIIAEDFLDNDLFSKVLIRTMIWNGAHTLAHANSRYYFNPYSLRLEPVSTDQEAFSLIPTGSRAKMKKWGRKFSHANLLYRALVRSPLFHQRFKLNLDAVLATLPTTHAAYQRLCGLFPLDCPTLDLNILAQNAKIVAKYGLSSLPSPRRSNKLTTNTKKTKTTSAKTGRAKTVDANLSYPRHIRAELLTSGILRLFNPLPEPVHISKVMASCHDKSPCEPVIIPGIKGVIEPGFGKKSNVKEFPLALGQIGARHILTVTTTVRNEQKTEQIKLSLMSKPYNPLTSLRALNSPPFVHVEGNIATIPPGTWQINQPLILPTGMPLNISAGAVLEFAPNAFIIVRGAFLAKGSLDNPIILRPSQKSWKGIYIVEASQKSHLSHVLIENTTSLSSGILQLTGGVSFYRSDVSISHVRFKGTSAEDALNIVHSNFKLENCVFSATVSDAFDSDFSRGSLLNVHFEQIGGDGLDTSGSTVHAQHLSFDGVFDKAVSSGEQSQVTISSLQAKNVGTAIVSKDNSTTKVEHLQVSSFRHFAGMAYEKKNFYGPARLIVSQTTLPASAFRRQKNSSMTVNGQHIAGSDVDVKALYQQGAMRKK